jgi:carbonic anhydrase
MAEDRQLGPMLKRAIDPMLKTDADKVLLLSCVDLRYPHRITDTMDAQGYRGKYYHLAMAGASHAAKHSSEWARAVKDHIAFGVDHGITGVVILDHMDCKAYELYEHVTPGGEEARQKHREVAGMVVADIASNFPTLAGYIHAMLLPKEQPPVEPEPLAEG